MQASPDPKGLVPGQDTTPTRRNKRKMTAPKRRSDFSIKRLCPDSPGSDGEQDLSPGEPSPSTSSSEDLTSPGGDRTPRPEEFTSRPGSQDSYPLPSTSSEAPVTDMPSSSSAAMLYPMPLPQMPMTGPPELLQLRLPGGGFVMSGIPHPGVGMTLPVTLATEPRQEASPDPDQDQDDDDDDDGDPHFKRPRKNYKNMTRERRVEANARERSRVHTISAAFDSLRRAVPSYSYNQKLSKLAILRIACSYIMALARLADVDYSPPGVTIPSFADCVDMCTRTIQTEGRARRRH